MVTIKMIAKECGFSIATVSKALNGAPDISAETKETIRGADPHYFRSVYGSGREVRQIHRNART